MKRLHQARLARFLLVGLGNTTVNFVVLNVLVLGMHIAKIPASIAATSCAILFSFIWNRRYVFKDKRHPIKLLPPFLVVSSIGTLAVQSSTYALGVWALEHIASGKLAGFAVINISNLIASFVVMFWNYNGYRLAVFNRQAGRDIRDAREVEPSTE